MDTCMIRTFESDTGYIRNKASKVVYAANVIYLGIYDTVDNYEEATEADYDAYMASEKLKLEEDLKSHNIKPE